MPVYCYKLPSGKIHEEVMSIAEKELREGKGGKITLNDGTKATRDFGAEGGHSTHGSDNWPIHSVSMGVSKKQVLGEMARAKACGVPTEFDKTGRPILTSPAHKRRYAKTRGMVDMDSFC